MTVETPAAGGPLEEGEAVTEEAAPGVGPPPSPGEVGRWLAGRWRRRGAADELGLCREYEEATEEELRLRQSRRELADGVDPHDLEQTGWGVVFPQDGDPAVRRRLQPLLERRREQAGARYKDLTYERDESARRFLWYRHGESAGVLDPEVLPYYLLLAGSPEEIPFEFQYQLGINHAVGRLDLRPREGCADYEAYARSVLAAEDRGVELPRRAAVVSVQNGGDPAMASLARHLVAPVAEALDGHAGWEVDVRGPERSYKRDLARLLADERPGLLLASCHGLQMPFGDARQEDWQGALLCEDWQGGGDGGPITPDRFFHGEDVGGDADPHGLVAFLFACYGAGTPDLDNFPGRTVGDNGGPPADEDLALARRPFTAHLPQALLGRGALGVVGHVDRGWTLSFQWPIGDGSQLASRSLIDVLRRLLRGDRLGHSLRPLVRRYTALAAQLAEPMERVVQGEEVDEELLGMQWVAHNDARNFVLLGDPAVYLLGRRCWEGSEGEPNRPEASPASPAARLEPELLRRAERRAREKGMTVEEWLDEAVRGRLGDSGGGGA